MTLMKIVGLVITITAVRVEVGVVQGIFEDLLGARTRELEVLIQIPSAVAKIPRDLREPTVEDNPVLTGKVLFLRIHIFVGNFTLKWAIHKLKIEVRTLQFSIIRKCHLTQSIRLGVKFPIYIHQGPC